MKEAAHDNPTERIGQMTDTSVRRLILRLSIPTTVSVLTTNFYNLADTYFVSSLNLSASGATGIVFSLMAMIQAVGFLFGQGAGTLFGRHLGAQKEAQARRYASTGFFLSLATGCAMAVIGVFLLTPVVYLLGSTDTIFPYAKTYAFYIVLAAPAMTTSCVINNLLRYEGRAKLAMIGLVSGAMMNVAGDFFLIRVFGLGIMGAGISTALSQYISAGILLYLFTKGRTQAVLSLHLFDTRWREIWRILYGGLPSLARQGLTAFSGAALNWVCLAYGDAAVAAMSIVSRIGNFLTCLVQGIAQGFQPVCAYNYGAGRFGRVKEGFLFTIRLEMGILLLAALATAGYASEVIGLFRTEPEVVTMGKCALMAQCAALVFTPISSCGNIMMQGVGRSGQALILSCLRSGACFVPTLFLLQHYFGILGVQLAQPVATVAAAVITIPFLARFFQKLPT